MPTPIVAYDLWADSYPPVAHNPLMRLEQEIVESILLKIHVTRALDVGTGSGRYLRPLAAAGAVQVVGVDFSMAMLRKCVRAAALEPFSPTCDGAVTRSPQKAGKEPLGGRASHASTALVCADAGRLPFRRRSFDVINASLMVGDVSDLLRWTREMARALTLGGHLVYSDFHPSWAEHGWKRAFRAADGAACEIAFAAHSIDEHLAALTGAGLRVLAIREPRFKDDSDPAVKTFRRRWKNPPVVIVFHAMKEP